MNKDNFSGMRFGEFVALSYYGVKNQRSLWLCRCNCGNEKIVFIRDLKRGHTKSCGCLRARSYKNLVLDQNSLRTHLHYDPETGIFTWIRPVRGSVSRGDIAGRNLRGYIRIGVLGKVYFAHRLAWLYMNGAWPKHNIDHINGISFDNRYINLREATTSENNRNNKLYKTNKSGHKGVHWHKRDQAWYVSCGVDGKRFHLGKFHDLNEAIASYDNFAKKHHGKFYRPAEAK